MIYLLIFCVQAIHASQWTSKHEVALNQIMHLLQESMFQTIDHISTGLSLELSGNKIQEISSYMDQTYGRPALQSFHHLLKTELKKVTDSGNKSMRNAVLVSNHIQRQWIQHSQLKFQEWNTRHQSLNHLQGSVSKRSLLDPHDRTHQALSIAIGAIFGMPLLFKIAQAAPVTSTLYHLVGLAIVMMLTNKILLGEWINHEYMKPKSVTD